MNPTTPVTILCERLQCSTSCLQHGFLQLVHLTSLNSTMSLGLSQFNVWEPCSKSTSLVAGGWFSSLSPVLCPTVSLALEQAAPMKDTGSAAVEVHASFFFACECSYPSPTVCSDQLSLVSQFPGTQQCLVLGSIKKMAPLLPYGTPKAKLLSSCVCLLAQCWPNLGQSCSFKQAKARCCFAIIPLHAFIV